MLDPPWGVILQFRSPLWNVVDICDWSLAFLGGRYPGGVCGCRLRVGRMVIGVVGEGRFGAEGRCIGTLWPVVGHILGAVVFLKAVND